MAGYHLAKTQDFLLESAHSLIVRIAIHGNISMWKRNKTQIYPVDVLDIFSLFWAWPTETAQNRLNISTGIESMSNSQVPLSYTIAERKLCILILDDAKTANSVRPSIIIKNALWDIATAGGNSSFYIHVLLSWFIINKELALLVRFLF